jgi:hypothetical protein
VFRVSVPSNWRELKDSDAVTFAPQGAYGTVGGQNVFTHGVQLGLAGSQEDLRTTTEDLIEAFARGNPDLRHSTGFERITVDGQPALRTQLTNINEATGNRETIQLVTTELADDEVLYVIGVAPTSAYGNTYRPVFDRVIRSIQLR